MPRLLSGPMLVAAVATVATLATLGPGSGGPGVTCDEGYHVGTGKRLVTALRHQGPAFFTADNIRQNFPWRPGGAPVHPPLGNWILGWTHHLFDPAPDDPSVISIAAARFAPAVAFGMLVLLVGLWTSRAQGPVAGTFAAAAVGLVPRMFAHAHFAALDMLTTLFFVAAVLAIARAVAGGGKPWRFAPAGVVWGLAMLVRIHGLLLFPPACLWLIWRLRRQAMLPLLVWGATGTTVLFAGWPWLWLAPLAHFSRFLGTATDRLALHVFYLGRVWADRDVPWHYPMVMFCVTLPLGLLLLGLLGLWAKRRSWQDESGHMLVIGTLLFVLLVFSWPGTPVYDGVRLLLMVFPLWAVFVGAGVRWVVEHPAWRDCSMQRRLATVGSVVILQGIELVLYHPCQLSHYSLVVGGLAGAERLGFEVTYWGDTVEESLLAKAALAEVQSRPPGKPRRVLFAPNLAPFQSQAVNVSSPSLMENEVLLEGWDPSRAGLLLAQCRWAVVYNRKADLAPVRRLLESGRVVAENEKQGVWLARLIELPELPGGGEQ